MVLCKLLVGCLRGRNLRLSGNFGHEFSSIPISWSFLSRGLGVKQNLDGVSKLVLDTEVGLGVQEFNHGVGKGGFLVVNSFKHISPHHHRIMIKECNKDIDTSGSHGGVGVFYGKSNDVEKAVADKIGEQVCPCWSLEILRNRSALMQKMHSVLSSLDVVILSIEHGK